MPETDFRENKLEGFNKIVQVDKTMLNYKCKSHRGRSPNNKTDALCIVEVSHKITRCDATVIPNKQKTIIISIICSQVLSGSTIHTDEHLAYKNLTSQGYTHGTICHKYNFIDRSTGVHTQAVESFNNCLKKEINNRKGIITEKRGTF